MIITNFRHSENECNNIKNLIIRALVGSVAGTLLGGGAGDVYARATQKAKINEAERLYNKRKAENPFRAHEIPVMKLPFEKRKRLATTFAKIDAKNNDEALRNAHKEQQDNSSK